MVKQGIWDIQGNYPEKENEIMLSSNFISVFDDGLGFTVLVVKILTNAVEWIRFTFPILTVGVVCIMVVINFIKIQYNRCRRIKNISTEYSELQDLGYYILYA